MEIKLEKTIGKVWPKMNYWTTFRKILIFGMLSLNQQFTHLLLSNINAFSPWKPNNFCLWSADFRVSSADTKWRGAQRIYRCHADKLLPISMLSQCHCWHASCTYKFIFNFSFLAISVRMFHIEHFWVGTCI